MKSWYNTIHLSIVKINKNGREKKKKNRDYKNCEKPDESSLSYLERYQTYFDFNPVCVSKKDC